MRRALMSIMIGVAATIVIALTSACVIRSTHSIVLQAPQEWPARPPASWPPWPPVATEIVGDGNFGHEELVYLAYSRDYGHFVMSDLRAGWPCWCLRACDGCTQYDTLRTGHRPEWLSGHSMNRWRLRPVPMGLAIDTALFAALAQIIWWPCARCLRGRRSRLGLCRACAYDLAGVDSDTCPECGSAR